MLEKEHTSPSSPSVVWDQNIVVCSTGWRASHHEQVKGHGAIQARPIFEPYNSALPREEPFQLGGGDNTMTSPSFRLDA